MTPKLLNILLLALSWFLYSYVVNPLYSGTPSFLFEQGQSFKNLVQKRNAYDKTTEEVKKLILQSSAAKNFYENISETDRKNILVMVPISVNDIKLMSELTDIGLRSGVPIENMGIKDKGAGVYSVSFSVVTTYTNFKRVIAIWEKNMRLFTLESVTFTPGKTEEEPIKFNVDLSTYYMK
jgi:hypothetical protein